MYLHGRIGSVTGEGWQILFIWKTLVLAERELIEQYGGVLEVGPGIDRYWSHRAHARFRCWQLLCTRTCSVVVYCSIGNIAPIELHVSTVRSDSHRWRGHNGVLGLIRRRRRCLLDRGVYSIDVGAQTKFIGQLSYVVGIAIASTELQEILELLGMLAVGATGGILGPTHGERWIGQRAMFADEERTPDFVDIALFEESNDHFAVVPVVSLQAFIVVCGNVIAALLPLVEKLTTETTAPSSAAPGSFNVFCNRLRVRTVLAAVRVTVMGLEESFRVKNDITVRARILHLLFVVALLVDFPVVLASKAFVARRAEILLLGLQLGLTLTRRWSRSRRVDDVILRVLRW